MEPTTATPWRAGGVRKTYKKVVLQLFYYAYSIILKNNVVGNLKQLKNFLNEPEKELNLQQQEYHPQFWTNHLLPILNQNFHKYSLK